MNARLLLLVVFLFPEHLAAQTLFGCNQGWGTVPRMSGNFTITGSGSGPIPGAPGYKVSVNQSIRGSFNMMAVPVQGLTPTCYLGQWSGPVITDISIDDTSTFSSPTGDSSTYEAVVSHGQNLPGNGIPQLSVNPLNGTFFLDIYPPGVVDVREVNATVTDTEVHSGTTTKTTGVGPIYWGPTLATSFFLTEAIPSSVGAITGSTTFQASTTDSTGAVAQLPVTWTMTWNIAPIFANFDLTVMIPEYSTWRPTAGRTEKDTGRDPVTGQPNLLEIDAQLVDTTTGVTSAADKLVFSLVRYSTVPGVAMNWPPQEVATTDPDISFDQIENPFATITDNGTTAVTVASNGLPAPPTVFLSPHDWGGYATLNVTAFVNGQQVVGHLSANQGGSVDILLPKRQPGSFIADSWKAAQNPPISRATPDNDDSEDDPVGDGKGDGFTLYEEYRGFYMGCSNNNQRPTLEGSGGLCQHVEGNPNKKDLFVVNEVRFPANLGIAQFQKSTGLQVHYKNMQLAEMNPSRVLNFNSLAGVHVADQHGLRMVMVARSGVACVDGGPGTPKNVNRIEISTSFGTYGDYLLDKISILTGDKKRGVIHTVAHELGHSVNAWHHGETDRGKVLWQLVGNQVKEVTFDAKGDPNPAVNILILPETVIPANDPAAASAASVTIAQTLDLPNYFYVGNDVTDPAGLSVLGSQHSGDEVCFMRYDCADAYIPYTNLADPMVRYKIMESPGFSFTDEQMGTGVNDRDNDPRPRYGGASPNRGDCKSQLCVNDGANPQKRGDRGNCPPLVQPE
jgi:hypothetical protein